MCTSTSTGFVRRSAHDICIADNLRASLLTADNMHILKPADLNAWPML